MVKGWYPLHLLHQEETLQVTQKLLPSFNKGISEPDRQSRPHESRPHTSHTITYQVGMSTLQERSTPIATLHVNREYRIIGFQSHSESMHHVLKNHPILQMVHSRRLDIKSKAVDTGILIRKTTHGVNDLVRLQVEDSFAFGDQCFVWDEETASKSFL